MQMNKIIIWNFIFAESIFSYKLKQDFSMIGKYRIQNNSEKWFIWKQFSIKQFFPGKIV